MTREEAINLIDNLIGFIDDNQGNDYDEAFKLAIEALEKEACEVEPTRAKGKWIPVEERLPEAYSYGKYLVTIITTSGTLWTKTVIANYSDLMGIVKGGRFWIGEVGENSFQNITEQVVAWMPLPTPYEPQKSEKKNR